MDKISKASEKRLLAGLQELLGDHGLTDFKPPNSDNYSERIGYYVGALEVLRLLDAADKEAKPAPTVDNATWHIIGEKAAPSGLRLSFDIDGEHEIEFFVGRVELLCMLNQLNIIGIGAGSRA